MAVAIDKYVCPFCGQKTLFVGVHDDEGNYKGRPGCDYESNSWSGLCYAIHHDGWGDCILCTDAHDLPLGGCFFDTEKEALEAIPTLTPPNEWISVEERVPTDERPVLVFVGYADTMTGFITTSSYFCFDVNPHWQWDGLVRDEQRTLFWMPLPAPPDRRPPEGEANA